MSAPDEIIHQSHRLRIMAALDGDPDTLDFSRLKSIAGATDGNLGAHLATLEKAGYVVLVKEQVGRRTRTLVHLSPSGRKAFRAHLEFLKSIIEVADASHPKS